MEYQDYNPFMPEPIKIISEEGVYEFLRDPTYQPLFDLLMFKQPQTLEEITESYNDKYQTTRDKTTIFRQLQKLQKFGFIVKTGQRVYTDKSSTSTLYALSGKFFYFIPYQEGYYNTKNGKMVLKHLTNLLKFYFKDKTITQRKVKDFFDNVHQVVESKIKDNYQEFEDEIQSIYEEIPFAVMYRFTILIANAIMTIDNDEFQKILNDYLR